MTHGELKKLEYSDFSRIERFFNRAKNSRRLATRGAGLCRSTCPRCARSQISTMP